jgi:hypothetical protein
MTTKEKQTQAVNHVTQRHTMYTITIQTIIGACQLSVTYFEQFTIYFTLF